MDPNNIHAIINKDVALYNLKKYNESLVYFDKALYLDPNNQNALNNKETVLKQINLSNASTEFGGNMTDSTIAGGNMTSRLEEGNATFSHISHMI